MLKIPYDTWKRLDEFRNEHGGKWPRVTSLHNGVAILLDLHKSTVDQGGNVEMFRDHGSYGYGRDKPVQGKMTFPKGIPKPKADKKSKK